MSMSDPSKVIGETFVAKAISPLAPPVRRLPRLGSRPTGTSSRTSTTAAAWLHDTVEDTITTTEQLRLEFGDRVATMVEGCTGIGKNRKARTACILKKLSEPEYWDSIIVKLADREANMLSSKASNPKLYRMYMDELEAFLGVCEAALDAPEEWRVGSGVAREGAGRIWGRLYGLVPDTFGL